MPESDIITSSQAESRSYEALVTQARIDMIASAAEAFCSVVGTYPSGYPAMVQFKSQLPPDLASCALQEDLLDDAWGRPIFYAGHDPVIHIVSAGADGRFTTNDDVTLPEPTDSLAEPIDLTRDCASRRNPLR
jgi:hypothetical protein